MLALWPACGNAGCERNSTNLINDIVLFDKINKNLNMILTIYSSAYRIRI